MKRHLHIVVWALLTPGACFIAANPAPTTAPSQPEPRREDAVPVPTTADAGDLRDLIGINHDFTRVEMGNMPEMSMRGYVQPADPRKPPTALLEITQMKRLFLVQVGTEIPVMVTGRVTPVARNELSGLHEDVKPAAPPAPADSQQQSQIILKVVNVTAEGVVVKAGLQAQTIIVR